jgi:Tfp pilus assembly PilM family ATPase
MSSTPLVGTTFFGLDISQLGSQLMSVRRRLSKRLLLLEFSASGLRYAEAAPSLDGIRLSHISRVPLPEEALERGVPSDPALMASLVQQLCQEKRIPAHRAAVVLSPDVAYQRIVELPSALTKEEARLYLLDPANGAPLPFPLEQTDFDLYPLSRQEDSSSQSYLLIAVPQALIDRVISLLDAAGFELQALELGPFCLLRFLADQLMGLRDSELHLVLELLPDCSQLTVVSSSGPIRFERLSAIRDFPDPELNDEQRKEALDAGSSAEELTLNDDRYLPISELDLRAVVRDLKAVISGLKAHDASTVVRGLTLSGINSAHPLIKDLFQDALGCGVALLNPVLMPRVTGFSLDDLLVQAGLARLIGLGLGFLPREQLLSCGLAEVSPPVASPVSPALAVEASIDAEAQPITSEMAPLDVDVIPFVSDGQSDAALDESLSQEKALSVEVAKEVEESEVSEVEEEWPSLGLDVEVKAEVVEVEAEKVVEDPVLSEGKEVWPSIKSIPGLELSQSQPSSEISKSKKSPTSSVIEDASESSSLGKLRFQDD